LAQLALGYRHRFGIDDVPESCPMALCKVWNSLWYLSVDFSFNLIIKSDCNGTVTE
jgi:hypothetical protein